MSNSAVSTGKCILSGEHSVVYGEPAVVTTLAKTVSVYILPGTAKHSPFDEHIFSLFGARYNLITTRLSLQVQSKIPRGVGLGSSAAYAYAVFQALAKYFEVTLSKETYYQLVNDAEKYVHSNPSGVDAYAAVYGGTTLFLPQNTTKMPKVREITLSWPHTFLLINSGKAQESTGEMVNYVAINLRKDSNLLAVIKNMGTTTKKCVSQLENGRFSGAVLDENQKYLEQLGVVGSRAKKMIRKIQNTGGHAKITGAGGRQSGSGFILAYSPELSKIEALCDTAAWESFRSTVQ